MPGKKLLVSDDSLTIQKVIRLALTNESYEIQTVSDGNDAIQQISLFRPDVVLIDISLPGKSAFEVKREINSHGDLEEVRFILMSSAFESVDENQVQEVEFHGRLTKPFDPAHLRQLLTEVLDQVTARRMEKTTIITQPHLQSTGSANSLEQIPLSTPDISKISEFDANLTRETFANIPSHPELQTDPQAEFPSDFQTSQEMTSSHFVVAPPLPQSKISEGTNSLISIGGTQEIQTLTNTTIKTTDEYEWSVTEPSLKPLSNMFETQPSNFSLDFPPPEEDLTHSKLSELQQRTKTLNFDRGTLSNLMNAPAPPPFPQMSETSEMPEIPGFNNFSGMQTMNKSVDSSKFYTDAHEMTTSDIYTHDMNSDEMRSDTRSQDLQDGIELTLANLETKIIIPEPKNFQNSYTQQDSTPSVPVSSPSHLTSHSQPQMASPMISDERLEEIIRTQVESALQKFAQKMLPEVAERVIKQEIHRLLSEQ